MQKTKMFLVLIAMAFLVTPQLGFTQTMDDLNKLDKIKGNLAQISKELLEVQGHYLSLWESSLYTNTVKAAEYELQSGAITIVTNYLDKIQTEIRCPLIWLFASGFIKYEYKATWDNITKQEIEYSIGVINLQLEGIAKTRARITNTAALHSIERANDNINEALTILRKAEGRGN